MDGVVFRPVLQIRVMTDKELDESQVAGSFLGLHNADLDRLGYRQRIFVKIGPDAPEIDKLLKANKNLILECPTCGHPHSLHYGDDGWAMLGVPV